MKPTRWLSWGLILALVLVVLLYLRMAFEDPVDYVRGGFGSRDFKAYYVAVRLLQRGESFYDPMRQLAEHDALNLPRDDTLYIYPSAFALALLPLANLSIENAAQVWNGINLVLLTAAFVLVIRATGLDRRLGVQVLWFVILAALAFPTRLAFRVGQANILLLFLLALGLYAATVQRDVLAGSALGLAALIKIFPIAFLLWMLARRDWRVMVWGAVVVAGVLVLSALSMALLIQNPWMDLTYLTQVLPALTETRARLGNESVNGFVSRWMMPPFETRLAVIGLSALIAGATVVALWQWARGGNDHASWAWRTSTGQLQLDWAVLLTALLLVSSITWESTFVLLIIPLAIYVRAWIELGTPRELLLLLGVSYLLINATPLIAMVDVLWLNSPIMNSLSFFGTGLVWGIGMVLLYRLQNPAHWSQSYG